MKTQSFLGNSLKKGDFLIFGLVAAIMTAAAIGFYKTPLSAHSVTIYVDSREYATYAISQDTEKIVSVQTEFGYNQIKLQKNTVQIIESDCLGHDCVQMGSASQAGDMLICLPHKLMVILEGGDSVDAVSY